LRKLDLTGFTAVILALFSWTGSASSQTIQDQRTYVFVHGSFSSIATYLPLESILEEDGHRVHLASLTGLGDRAHLQSPDIRLETHIQDVASLIETRDLHDVYLVGHSYGGMVVTGVWDRVRDRVHHIVYLDAFVPEEGRSAHDYSTEEYRGLTALAAENDGMLPNGMLPSRRGGPPQSLYTFIDPLVLQNGPLPEDTQRTFVRAIGNSQREPDPTFQRFADELRNDPNWNYVEIETGHGIQVQDPAGLARILVGLE
jgi:pimeloyl-ACP methyl ester carboxylesterase